ncbi:protein rolling stone [Clupea harengus]|uniref:Protein rolling stone n=1 Tax=Clupea harengus TaxID=7950 RepID=A0A6P3VQ68_CLUHA|nr:protein rolling stone [Clupea harengus]
MGASWTRSFRKEFQVKKLNIFPSTPELLLEPRWHIPPWAWLLYRLSSLIYTLAWCIHSALLFATPKWLILLSHLTYCMLGVYYLTALVNLAVVLVSIRRFCGRKVQEKSSGVSSERRASFPLTTPLAVSLCLQWLLQVIVSAFSLIVSLLYWSIHYPVSRHPIRPFSINLHVVNSAQVLLDLFLSSTPVHLSHYVYLLAAGLLYLLFALVFWLGGFTNIYGEPYVYPVLDFGGQPVLAVLCTLGFALICLPLFHLVLWNVHLLRERLARGPWGKRFALRREAWWWGGVGGLAPFPSPALDPELSVFAGREGEPQLLLTAPSHGYCSLSTESPSDCHSSA